MFFLSLYDCETAFATSILDEGRTRNLGIENQSIFSSIRDFHFFGSNSTGVCACLGGRTTTSIYFMYTAGYRMQKVTVWCSDLKQQLVCVRPITVMWNYSTQLCVSFSVCREPIARLIFNRLFSLGLLRKMRNYLCMEMGEGHRLSLLWFAEFSSLRQPRPPDVACECV